MLSRPFGLWNKSRFFVHKSIEAFANAIVKEHGTSAEKAFLFPSHSVAKRCARFLQDQVPSLGGDSVRIVDLRPNDGIALEGGKSDIVNAKAIISAVIFPQAHTKVVKTFWQHSGDGISSRRAEYCYKAYEDGRLDVWRAPLGKANGDVGVPSGKGPRRYQRNKSGDFSPKKQSNCEDPSERTESVQFVEERFGRNLDVTLAASAKLAIRRRIAGALTANVDLQEALELLRPPARNQHVEGFSEDDVYLYPCGMSSIFNMHRTMLACRGSMKSVSFG